MSASPPTPSPSDTQPTQPVQATPTPRFTEPVVPVVPPQQRVAHQPHVRAAGSPVPHTPREQARRARRAARQRSPLYLPWWSLVLVLFGVVGVVTLVVGAVWALRGTLTPPAPTGVPFVVVTGDVPLVTTGVPLASPTLPAVFALELGGTPPPLVMRGPNLEPIQLTATPALLQVGATVRVVRVFADGLNIRPQPGTSNAPLFRAPEDTRMRVIGGPVTVDGVPWWQVQRQDDPSQQGWAHFDYLEVVP